MFRWWISLAAYFILVQSSSGDQSRSLERESSISSIRLSIQIVEGAFSEANKVHLQSKVLPSVQDFYSSAISLNRLSSKLKPSLTHCNSILVPDLHRSEGLEADVIIYLHSDAPYDSIAIGKFCEQEQGTFKRPLVGTIGINFVQFFHFVNKLQIEYLIREVAHVLVFDTQLFNDFVRHDGTRYSETQYSLKVNFPERGKTVETIAFPQMLDRARVTFDCRIEGLELEDYFSLEVKGSSGTFWDSRIMTHDILSSKMSQYTVFSDITLALFDDSGWYYPELSYGQTISQGSASGCSWFEQKCLQSEKSVLPGFCDQSTAPASCDFFSLGYGDCHLAHSGFIPPHEQYFADPTLGGLEVSDFCPVVVSAPQNSCRDLQASSNSSIGEVKGRDSRCFMQNVLKTGLNGFSNEAAARGACYVVEKCRDEAVTIKVGSTVVDCPYGSQITVQGFAGYVLCPSSKMFCSNVPCPSLCYGRGVCINGACVCRNGWGGSDCEMKCEDGCRGCSVANKCESCEQGFFLQGSGCVRCSDSCLSCNGSPDTCTACAKGSELVGSVCKTSCIENCAACDEPCSRCDIGYFVEGGKCSQCDNNCRECSQNSKKCVSCRDGFKVYLNSCVPLCLDGCKVCEYPCSSCKSGYLLKEGACEACDNVCATCEGTRSKCTSCLTGFVLIGQTCVQGCKANCLSCDDPCSKCEDGYYPLNGSCNACDVNCMTCLRNPTICTSCKVGYYLKGATCLQQCVSNCKTCSFPCSECKDGYFEDEGLCSECSSNCKTCAGFESSCLSCYPGYGLIEDICKQGCSDHCLSCDTPCTVCTGGYYKQNGVCLKCDESCLTCTFSGSNHCIACAEGYTKIGSVCRKGCQEHCSSCDEPCTRCDESYYPYELGCQVCKIGCRTCTSYEKCQSCIEGYGLISGYCQLMCLDHCQSCDVPCSLCESGYYLSEGKCSKCPEGCLTCSKQNVCLSCQNGYELKDAMCTKGCIQNCLVCENPCQSCKLGYTLSSGYCINCPVGCESCASDMSKCYSCIDGYTYENYSCKKKCKINCQSCDDPCTVCDPGFLSIQGDCLPCLSPCFSCIGNIDRCSSCISGFLLDDYTCTASCVEHCKTCDDPCTLCDEGYILFKGVCEACSSNCRTCLFSPSNCITCDPWQILQNNKCVDTCIENCIDCSYPCRACNPGYTLLKGKCKSCKTYLSESDIQVDYIRDYSGLALTFSRPVVDPIDNCGQYFKIETLAMIGLTALCSWDKDDKLIVVYGENPDFNIKTLRMYPIISYGSNCSSVEVEPEVKIQMNYLPRPHISLSSPATFSLSCENNVLVIQALTDEEIYSFSFDTKPKLIKLELFLMGLTGKVLVVPESYLGETNLTVIASVTNKLNVTDHVIRVIRITNEHHLTVTIDTGSKLKLRTSHSHSVNGIVQFGSCFKHETLVYAWKYIPTSGQVDNEAVDIEDKARGSNKLFIPKNSLKAGKTYLFRFEVKNDKKFTYSEVQIQMVSSKLVALIDRSSSSAPINERLVLSAEASYDPDDPQSILKYEWTCSMLTSPCNDVAGRPLITSQKSSRLEIGSNRLSLGKTYMFTIKVSKGNRISRDSIFITASGSHSYAKIPQIIDEVNVGQDLYIYPKYIVPSNSCSFTWKHVVGPAVKTYSKANDAYLIINKDNMLAGQTYVFNVTGLCDGTEFFALPTWFTNNPPVCSGISFETEGNTLSIITECSDGELNDSPLIYIYGIVREKRFVPLRAVHSPSMIFYLNTGTWEIFVDVCDEFKHCTRKQKQVEIKGRKLQEDEHFYNLMRYYPDSIPLAILNSADSFNKENFKEAFADLKKYFEKQSLELVHMKMAIEVLEILTYSNQTHFMFEFQGEIVDLLMFIAERIDGVDDEVMTYVIELFSEHKVKEYEKVSNLIHQLSGKWQTKMPPGELVEINNKLELKRHRFVGHDSSRIYSSEYGTISNMVLEGKPTRVYDLVILAYPSSPSAVIDINYYAIGEYSYYSFEIQEARKEISIDIRSPFLINFLINEPGSYKCQQLRGSQWINEGCEIKNQTDKSILVETWHVSTYRIVRTKSTQRGITALIVDISMIAICLMLTSIFCITDKTKANYIQAPFVPDSPESPRNYVPENNPEEEQKKEEFDSRDPTKKLTVASSIDSFRSVQIPAILYHPWFNIIASQNGERRAASTLHMFAVLFGEFLAVGALYNPGLYEVFDENDKFRWFGVGQIVVMSIGVVLVQMVSVLLTYLNQVNDFTITKKYLGMTISSILIVFCSGLSLIFAYSYPHKYSLFWVLSFLVVVFFEVSVAQNLLWLVHYNLSSRIVDTSITRNIRVFTTES